MTLPNLISIGRIILVPFLIWLILEQRLTTAFFVFVIAGFSDAIDGYLARLMDARSELGTYLDPIADKALLISIFVALGLHGDVPLWLVILIVSRDVLIIGGVLLAWILGTPVQMKPRMISKINTTVQIMLASFILGMLAFTVDLAPLGQIMIYLVGLTTAASTGVYVYDWIRHMSGFGSEES